MMNKTDHEEILKNIQKPGRYTGGEWNAIHKDTRSVDVKVALAFPDVYEVGMSHLGQKILYDILNQDSRIQAERVFAPWTDYESELLKRKYPLCSLENEIPLSRFDIIGFSLLFELNYSNILSMLHLGGIPLLSSDRGLDDPLVIAGGPTAVNPEPVADIFDAVLIGDGEEGFIEIINVYRRSKAEGANRDSLLHEMTKIPGVYVPSLYQAYLPENSLLHAVKPERPVPQRIKKRTYFPFAQAPFPDKLVVPNISIIFDRIAVEIARGCPQNCRFCQARSVYFPYRIRDPKFILEKAIKGVRASGYEDLSLAALSVGDYPGLECMADVLMQVLETQKISLSLSALRPRGLTDKVAENIVKVRKTGLTLVPEAGTERLRRVINKHLADQEIWDAVENAFCNGWRKLKLYFMVGLPSEEHEDLIGIVTIVQKIVQLGYQILKKNPQINLSVSSFIPKPHTPFQWFPMASEEELREKHRFLKSGLKKYPFVRFKEHPIQSSLLEAVFSRGDRRLTRVLLSAWKKGARFESWKEQFNFSIWAQAFEEEGVDYADYLGPLKEKTVLPWDHIDLGLEKSYLLKEKNRAVRELYTPICQEELCSRCRGCSEGFVPVNLPPDKLVVSQKIWPAVSEKVRDVYVYRVFYSKRHRAKYYSHRDLVNIIQRSLRRAGIPVVFSQGYHPKMSISFAPALALGMEGMEEIFDFKSCQEGDETEMTGNLNKSFPLGITVTRIEKLKCPQFSLTQEIDFFRYSINLDEKMILKAAEKARQKGEVVESSGIQLVKGIAAGHLKQNQDRIAGRIRVDEREGKMFFDLKFKPDKVPRPQEIVKEIFDEENPAFLITRESIVLKHQYESCP